MSLFRDEGVVLRTIKLGEADRIVTVLTREHGKIRAVAKGVRRVKSRFGGRLEPFMRVDMLVAEGRSLDVVSQAASIATYAATICTDYAAYSAANVIVETADKLVSTEHEPAREQYLLTIGALHALADRQHAPEMISDSYVMRALAIAGWTPWLNTCVVCGTTQHLHYCSVRSGGAMCSTDRTPDALHIDDEARTQLAALVEGDWKVIDGAVPEPQVRRFVEDWGEYYLERPIRSMRLLDLSI